MNQQDNPERNQNQNLDQSPVSGQVGQGRDFNQLQNSSGNQIIRGDLHIHNYPEPRQPIPPETKRDVQNRHNLINDIKSEIADRLEQSLHNINPINLHKEKQPQQVQRVWDVDLKTGKSGATLPPETKIVDVFDQKAVSGRLLILGAPGSGKTTALLELAEVLLERAEQNPGFPIPVLFSLASWQKDGQSIAEWIVMQLKKLQGVSTKLSQEWLENGQLLPLLDGLDELKSERQERCVRAINQFVQDCRPQHLGVCSRLEEYERCPTKLELQGAVCLLPLTEVQIREYLRRTDCVEFLPHLQQDSNLLELAKTPLFLNVIALAYSEIALEEWQRLESFEMRQQYLFDAYLERMLKRDPISQRWYRRGKEPSAEQTKHWLRFLAKRLKAEGRTEFLIENIWSFWLQRRSQREIYGSIVGLTSGLIVGVGNSYSLGVFLGSLRLGVIWGVPFGLMAGLTNGLLEGGIGLELLKSVTWDESSPIKWEKLAQSLIYSFTLSLKYILIGGLIGIMVIGYLSFPILISIVSALLCGWTIQGCIFVRTVFYIKRYKEILKTSRVVYPVYPGVSSRPNHAIYRIIKNSAFLTSIVLILWAAIGVVMKYTMGQSFNITTYIASGFGLISISAAFGYVGIKHLSLRLTLLVNGLSPWNYARFLNCATERLLLQRVGGGYRFMHNLLREHFATHV